ncbi:MAG: FecR domain-containing protein [Arcticibacter sp.]
MEINDDLLISYLLNEASDDQVREIEIWLLSDPANQMRFRQFKLTWEASRMLDLDEEVDPKSSLERLKRKLQDGRERRSGIRLLQRRSDWLRAVAAIVLIFVAAWFYISNLHVRDLKSATDQLVKTDTLSDGSIVTLNKNSVIEYPSRFVDDSRQVVLQKGEAFFDVMPDKSRAFLIESGPVSIRVVGTSFNVKLVDGAAEIIVESGKVEVNKDGKKIFLEPGEKTVVSKHTRELEKMVNPDQLYNYYRTKEFVADDTPLWRMVQVLNEAYGSRIVIRNSAIKNLLLNTTFKDESLEEVLQVISRTFNITVEKKGDLIILK